MRTEITALGGGRKVELRQTQRAMTPFGGLVVFCEFLRRMGYREAVNPHLPFRLTSPQAIDPVATFTAFLLSVVAGARRFAHAGLLRADAGFFDQPLLRFLEPRGLSYIVVARRTRWLQREAAGVQPWRALDEYSAVGEFPLQLFGWDRARRFVVLRERLRRERASLGRKLIDVPGYTFPVFITNRSLPPEEIWGDDNRRADMENRIAELNYDLADDDFCRRAFFATEAAFRSIRLRFNLLGEFPRASRLTSYRRPATLRAPVFLCGALLGSAGPRLVLDLSAAWGGLDKRKTLLENVLSYLHPTSPKWAIQPSP